MQSGEQGTSPCKVDKGLFRADRDELVARAEEHRAVGQGGRRQTRFSERVGGNHGEFFGRWYHEHISELAREIKVSSI